MSKTLPERIASYRVIAKLGEGGMGEVFLAEDDHLHRRIAIKRVLPAGASDAQAARRLLTEARAAARLDHPHICPIFEVGEDNGTPFIVMPVVEGETLAARIARGPLPIPDAIDIAAQVADALAAAHAQGVLHRDIKPANLMINARGQVRVMDFGLATFAEGTDARNSAETASRLTVIGTTMGTAGYMSPEHVRGERLDATSDLFSLGVVLYEMVAGVRPFDRRTLPDSVSALLTEEPASLASLRPDVPAALQRIVTRALQKSSGERYQSAADLQADLARLRESGGTGAVTSPLATKRAPFAAIAAGLAILATVAVVWMVIWTAAPDSTPPGARTTPGGVAVDSLAVLPLANNTGSADKEFIADGITQTLIDSLAQLPSLKVISSASVFSLKGRTGDIPAIAKRLGVGAIMTGTISEADGRMVINVELSDGKDATIIWRDRYVQQPSATMLAMEAEIAQDVARHLRVTLTGDNERRLATVATTSPDAYQNYLKGRFYTNRGTPESLHQGIKYYEQAVKDDSHYAQAWSGLARAYLELGIFYERPTDTMPKAREYATRARDADPTMVDPRLALGLISLMYDRDWAAAQRALTTSSGLIPAAVEMFSCTAHLLESTGQGIQAERELQRALTTDPLSVTLNTELGCGSYYRRRYDSSIQENRDALEIDPANPVAYWGLGRAYGQMKRYAEALEALHTVEARNGSAPPIIVAEIGYVQAVSGHADLARATLRKLDEMSANVFVDPYLVATVQQGLGDRKATLEWLERAFDVKSGFLVSLPSEPKWDSVRSDPRFQDLVKRVGF